LNIELIQKAEQHSLQSSGAQVEFFFDHEATAIDFNSCQVTFRKLRVTDSGNKQDINVAHFQGDLILGTDGAYSFVRSQLMKTIRMDYQQKYCHLAYKELVLPSLLSDPSSSKSSLALEARFGGLPLLDVNYLHIWPRKDFMLIALANLDNTFTCTLFLSHEEFARLDSSSTRVIQFFQQHFPDFLELMGKDNLLEEYASHACDSLVSVLVSADDIGLVT
jgi:kynurenine 3-monooxygenase